MDCRDCLHCKVTVPVKRRKSHQLSHFERWLCTSPGEFLELVGKVPEESRGDFIRFLLASILPYGIKATGVKCTKNMWEKEHGGIKKYKNLQTFNCVTRDQINQLNNNGGCPYYEQMD